MRISDWSSDVCSSDLPERRGTAFWIERDGHVLLVTRPARGLLGGMRALPTTDWVDKDADGLSETLPGQWHVASTEVRHISTHFALTLDVAMGDAHHTEMPGDWWPVDTLQEDDLPTVVTQAAAVALTVRAPTRQNTAAP